MPIIGSKLPRVALAPIGGAPQPLAEALAEGPLLIALGHRNCKTTRQTLPYVDRIHRRGGRVLVVLQDDEETARALVAELDLRAPVRLEDDPYPLAEALGVTTVPTLMLVDGGGTIAKVSEAFRRDDLEAFAAAAGLAPPLFTPEDQAPAFKPG